MWERIAKCLGKGSGSRGATCGVKLTDLQSRVPPEQMKHFKRFVKKRDEYNDRLQKLPAEMPRIDWEYYRQNVSEDKVEWVNKFAEKYDQLDSMFANRHTLIDTSKYFCEVNEQTKEVQKEVDEFKKQSNERIAKLQQQIQTLAPLKPYEEMTMEEFCLARPDLAPDFINKPTFWPHTPEEQKPGPSEVDEHHEHDEHPKDPEGSKSKPKPKPKSEGGKPDPEKPPSQTPPAGAAPTDGKAQAPPAPEVKKELPKEEKPREEETNSVVNKAVDLATLLADKAVVACQLIVQKITDMQKGRIGKSAPDGMQKGGIGKSAPDAQIAKQPESVEDKDAFNSRETVSNICHKTIIRGEDTKEADVKPHHVDLDNQGKTMSSTDLICEKFMKELEAKEQICDQDEKTDGESPCKQESICDEKKAEELICDVEQKEEIECKPDPKCDEKSGKDICDEGGQTSHDACELTEDKKGTGIGQKLVKDDCSETFPNTSKPKATYDSGTIQMARINEPVSTLVDKDQDGKPMEIVYGTMSTPQTELQRFEEIKMINESFDLAKSQILDRESQMLENVVKEKNQALQVKSTLGDDVDLTAETSKLTPVIEDLAVKEVEPEPAQDVVCSEDAGGQPGQSKLGSLNTDGVAQFVFETTTSAAKLLSDAKETLEKAQTELGGDKQEMEAAYMLAAQKVAQALEAAQMALDSAKTLAKDSGMDKDTIALIEKNTELAQLMVSRAMAMKEEIPKLLSDLK